jgi:hypothetical protein
MIDYAYSTPTSGTQWSINGGHNDGATWLDATPKPTQAELTPLGKLITTHQVTAVETTRKSYETADGTTSHGNANATKAEWRTSSKS